jgi:UDP-glucose 4-epimerase
MNVLVTGGTGYVGSALIKALENATAVTSIAVYDNLSRGNYNVFFDHAPLTKVKVVQGDILDGRSLEKALKGIDVVYHLAAIVTTPFADSQVHQFEQVNHWGTAELARLIEENETVKKVVYLSSTSVYGASTKEVTTTTTPQPTSFYGISKLQGEKQLTRLRDKGVDVRIIRSGNVFGFGTSIRFDSVINKFMFEAHHFGRIKIFGDGNQQRSFVYLHRLVADLTEQLDTPSTNDIINGVDYVLSINDIVDEIKSIYPQLEMIFVNQNSQMRNLIVQPTHQIDAKQFAVELQEMTQHFSVKSL